MYKNCRQYPPPSPIPTIPSRFLYERVKSKSPTAMVSENGESDHLEISKPELLRSDDQTSTTSMDVRKDSFSGGYFTNCDKRSFRINITSKKLESLLELDYFKRHENQPAIKRGERAEERIVDAVERMRIHCAAGDAEPMCLISKFEFENYLVNPKATDPSSSSYPVFSKRNLSRKHNGEHDILILHLNHGVTFVQVKAIGEFNQVASDQVDWQSIKKRKDKHNRKIKDFIERGLKQLEKDSRMFHRVMNDLNLNVPVMKVLALPNIRRETLAKLKSSVAVLTLSLGYDALDRCIFSNEVDCTDYTGNSPLCLWWARNIASCAGFRDVDTYREVISRYFNMMSSSAIQSPEPEADHHEPDVQDQTSEYVVADERNKMKITNAAPELNDNDKRRSIIKRGSVTEDDMQDVSTEELQWRNSNQLHGSNLVLNRPHWPFLQGPQESISPARQHQYQNRIPAQGRFQRAFPFMNHFQNSDYIKCSRNMRAPYLTSGTHFNQHLYGRNRVMHQPYY